MLNAVNHSQNIMGAMVAAAIHVLMKRIVDTMADICRHNGDVCLGKMWEMCGYYHIYSKDGVVAKLEPILAYIATEDPILPEQQNSDVLETLNLLPSYLARFQLENLSGSTEIGNFVSSTVFASIEPELDRIFDKYGQRLESDGPECVPCMCGFCSDDACSNPYPDKPICSCADCGKLLKENIVSVDPLGELATAIADIYGECFTG